MSAAAAGIRHALRTADGVRLGLVRYPSGQGGKPVLLLHGATQASDTFTVGGGASLVSYLTSRGFDVWGLDWRGGKRVMADNPELAGDFDRFALDAAARNDVVAALGAMRAQVGSAGSISVVGHCMGGGTLAMAVAGGWIPPELGLAHVVFLTVGLFYRLGATSWLKAQDHILEQIPLRDREARVIHSSRPETWPDALAGAFRRWPRALLPRCDNTACHGLTFLFGGVFRAENLDPALHEEGFMREQFGDIPLALFLHATQNARRGFAAPLDAPGHPTTYLDPRPFSRLHTTLITGDENSLWHRSSIDLMYDWLRRAQPRQQVHKHVLAGYGHQDLLWGRRAPRDVFTLIERGLPC